MIHKFWNPSLRRNSIDLLTISPCNWISLSIRDEIEVKELLKKMKVFCGTGGTLIGEDIQLQGDMVNKSIEFLHKEGFQNLLVKS